MGLYLWFSKVPRHCVRPANLTTLIQQQPSAESQTTHPCHSVPSINITIIFFFLPSHPFYPLENTPRDNPWICIFFFRGIVFEKTLQNTCKKRKFLGTNSLTGVPRAIRKPGKSWRFYYSFPHTPHKNMYKKRRKNEFSGPCKVVLFKSHFLVGHGSLAEVIGDCGGFAGGDSLLPTTLTANPSNPFKY